MKERLKEGWEDINKVLHHQGLQYVPWIIYIELISRYHNDSLIDHFGINNIRELVGQKYYCPSLKKDVKAYIKGCNICLASKAVRHKPYGNLQALPVLTYQ